MEFVSEEKNKKKDVYLGENTTPEVDSLGSQLTSEQSAFFKNSKVRDRQGRLLVCYHGTDAKFTTFEKGDIGFHFGTESAANIRREYKDNPETWYVDKYYLNIKNYIDTYDFGDWDGMTVAHHLVESRLIDLDDEEIKMLQVLGSTGGYYDDATTKQVRDFLISKGIDGFRYENAYEDEGSMSYIAFNSNQIKSITNTNPTNSNNVNEELLSESLHKLGSDCFITSSPYDIKNLIMNKPKLYRILYDSNIDMYMIGDGRKIIHQDLLEKSFELGYYAGLETNKNFHKFIRANAISKTARNYARDGINGFYNDTNDVLEFGPYLLYMIFSPDENEFMLGEDSYDEQLKLNFGYLFLRDADQGVMDNCDLLRILQKQSWANVNESISHQDEKAVREFARDCIEDELPFMNYKEFANTLSEQGMTPNEELFKIYVDEYKNMPGGYAGDSEIADKIIDEFLKLSTEQIIQLVNIPNRTQIDTASPMFILPNGTIVSVKEVGENLGYDSSWIHGDLMYVILDTLANKLGLYYPTEMEDAENGLLEHLTDELGWARINCGTTWTEDRVYCVLPDKMTSSQFRSLEKWIEWGYDNHKGGDEVLICFDDTTRAYDFKDNFPEDIIKKIKRYYSSGRLYENRNEMKENMSIKPGDRVKMDYYAKPNNGATGICKGRIGQLCSIEWDDGSESNEITTYLTKIDTVNESIGAVDINQFTFTNYLNPDGQNHPNCKTYRSTLEYMASETESLFNTCLKNYWGETKPYDQLTISYMNLNRHSCTRDLVGAGAEEGLKAAQSAIFKRQGELLNQAKEYTVWDSNARQWVKDTRVNEDTNRDITNEVQQAVDNIMKNKSKYRTQDDLEDAIYSAVANCFSGLHGVTRDTADMVADVYEQELKRVGLNTLQESNELEQRAKKHKKKSKGMGWHMAFNAGDVEKGIEVFNSSTSLGASTSGGEGTAMGESVKGSTYCYNGPIYYDGMKIASKSNICTTAPSYNVALRNILFKAANGDKELHRYDIVDELVKEVSKDTEIKQSVTPREKCYRCGYELNDMGDCPVCDYGEDDLLESLSDLEALWKLSNID